MFSISPCIDLTRGAESVLNVAYRDFVAKGIIASLKPNTYMNEPVVWLSDGSPHSPRFNDRYRSRTGGLAQANTVFLRGCGLPEAWRGQSDFSILETGFGLGLNFLTTWASWEADSFRSDRLSFCSIEGYPVAPNEIVRNASACNEPVAKSTPASTPARTPAPEQHSERLQTMALELAHKWESLTQGIQVFEFAGGRVQLTLAVGDVISMLSAVKCKADSVFLDGFSPAVNPEMWSPATLRAVAAHCKPGTRLTTYTIAKSVRMALGGLGFQVKKCPGLPPKRDRLEAVLLASN
jgi:tRNA 5-methylaminomethyl-2-thiouridine biosynthesis bifunctional protein